MGTIPKGVGPGFPHVVVLVGCTGDLARRKLIPGLFHLVTQGFIPGCRIVGLSLDKLDADGFRVMAREAMGEFCTRPFTESEWDTFAEMLDYVPLDAGADALRDAVEKAEASPLPDPATATQGVYAEPDALDTPHH